MTVNITVTRDITINQIRNLLCCAFEGGVNYWCCISGSEIPGYHMNAFKEGGSMQDPNEYWHWSQLIPTTKGGCLWITAPDASVPYELPHKLDLEACQRGLQVMADKYPHHMSNLLEEHEDAETGDVYLQCCLYGEVVFG